MSYIDVISAGPGSPDLLTPEARAALAAAESVFCADRLSSLVPQPQKCRPLTPLAAALDALASCLAARIPVAVLVSGDAGFYSLLNALTRRFGQAHLRVFPGISSLQALAARLCVTWQDAALLSAHGRTLAPEALCHTVRTHSKTFLLLDSVHDPNWVRETLMAGDLAHTKLTIGERLTAPDERIAPYAPGTYDPLSLAFIENDRPACSLPPVGLEDTAFVRNRTPMTKREIRIQIMAALTPPPDAVIWDIGAGTGSVTVECARQCPFGQILAIEEDAAALEVLRANVSRFHLQNVQIIPGTAPEALAGLPVPTHVFLGGTGGHADEILHHLQAYHTPIRLCATTVTLESAATFLRLMRDLPRFSAVQIAVSRLDPAGSVHLFRAQNPVCLFSADLGPTSDA